MATVGTDTDTPVRRPSRVWALVALAGLAAVLFAAVWVMFPRGQGQSSPSSVPTAVSRCDDVAGGSCPAGFTLKGVQYNITCIAANPGLVTADTLGRGRIEGRVREIRRVAGVDSAKVVAIQQRPGCGESPSRPGEWSLAHLAVMGGDDASYRLELCKAATPGQPGLSCPSRA